MSTVEPNAVIKGKWSDEKYVNYQILENRHFDSGKEDFDRF